MLLCCGSGSGSGSGSGWWMPCSCCCCWTSAASSCWVRTMGIDCSEPSASPARDRITSVIKATISQHNSLYFYCTPRCDDWVMDLTVNPHTHQLMTCGWQVISWWDYPEWTSCFNQYDLKLARWVSPWTLNVSRGVDQINGRIVKHCNWFITSLTPKSKQLEMETYKDTDIAPAVWTLFLP